jgi:hypothetical protein
MTGQYQRAERLAPRPRSMAAAVSPATAWRSPPGEDNRVAFNEADWWVASPVTLGSLMVGCWGSGTASGSLRLNHTQAEIGFCCSGATEQSLATTSTASQQPTSRHGTSLTGPVGHACSVGRVPMPPAAELVQLMLRMAREVVPGSVGVEVGSSVWSGSCETLRQTAKSAGGPRWQDRTRPHQHATRRSTRAR